MIPVPRWEEIGQPACAGEDPAWWYANDKDYSLGESLFTFDEAGKLAIEICMTCDILEQCRDWGLKHEYYGIFGGMTANARRNYRDEHGIPYTNPINSIEISKLMGVADE